ncbi:MAG: lipopolysaccharide heptosyltransferase II, partial [Dehalococcoidia bacterium]|nr:lipopolysaccharide heptosyltransferase II [Dehalococcoidia bacterium]
AATVLAFVVWLREKRSQHPAKLEPKRILLIRLDLLGDLILTMPAVASLRQRYPQAHIAMLVLPYTAPAVSLFPYVDKLFTYDINKLRPSGDMLNPAHYLELWRLIKRLRRERYDLSVSFYGLYAGILALLSGARRRIGYRAEGCPFLYNLPVRGRRYMIRQHEVKYCLTLAKAAGASDPGVPLHTTIPDSARERIATLLAQEGIGPQDLMIAIHPGSNNGTAKRWTASGWTSLADRLVHDMGARVIINGVASELPLIQGIVGSMSARPTVMAGKTSILELAALLSRCQALVAGDSAPLHMAWALGTPVVGLYGPTDAAISGPYGSRNVVIRKETGCPPCYDLSDTAECSKGNPVCMETITPDEVYAAVESLLRAPQRTIQRTATQ